MSPAASWAALTLGAVAVVALGVAITYALDWLEDRRDLDRRETARRDAFTRALDGSGRWR